MAADNYDPNVVRALKAIEKNPDVTTFRYSVALAELRLAKLVYTASNGFYVRAHLTAKGREVLERTNA